MAAAKKTPYFKQTQQDVLVDGLNQFAGRIREISQKCLRKTGLQVTVERMIQFVILELLRIIFGLTTRAVHWIFSSHRAERVKTYFELKTGRFPGGSTVNRRLPLVRAAILEDIQALAMKLIDYFYLSVGQLAREGIKALFAEGRVKVTPPA